SLTVSAIARLLAYIVTCAGLIALRRRDEREMRFKAQFKAPAGVAVSVAALGLCVWLLADCKGRGARDAAIATMLGVLIYGAYRLARRRSDVEEVVQSTQT